MNDKEKVIDYLQSLSYEDHYQNLKAIRGGPFETEKVMMIFFIMYLKVAIARIDLDKYDERDIKHLAVVSRIFHK